MFDDILKKDLDPPIEDEYEKHEELVCEHDESCNCDDCIIEAIKIIASKLNLDLTDEAIEEIKKEYLDKCTDPKFTACWSRREGMLAFCISVIFDKNSRRNM